MRSQQYNQIEADYIDEESGKEQYKPLTLFAQIFDSRDPLELNNGFLQHIHTEIQKEFEEWLYPVHIEGYHRRV